VAAVDRLRGTGTTTGAGGVPAAGAAANGAVSQLPAGGTALCGGVPPCGIPLGGGEAGVAGAGRKGSIGWVSSGIGGAPTRSEGR
jgi:hypothetical protein